MSTLLHQYRAELNKHIVDTCMQVIRLISQAQATIYTQESGTRGAKQKPTESHANQIVYYSSSAVTILNAEITPFDMTTPRISSDTSNPLQAYAKCQDMHTRRKNQDSPTVKFFRITTPTRT